MKKILFLLLTFFSLTNCAVGKAPINHNESYHFLVISDIHLDNDSTYPMEINPSEFNKNNDLDSKTFSQLIDTLSKNTDIQAKQPQFILVLGDIVGHDRMTEESAIKSETVVFKKLKDQFGNTPIFYVFGNNDSVDINYGSFYSKSKNTSPYNIAQKEGWKNGFLSSGQHCTGSLFPCLATANEQQGYYSAYLQPKLKLISLNSILCSPRRLGVTEVDVENQFIWLEKQLKFATEHEESVIIAMHIPMGKNVFDDSEFWIDPYFNRFKDLIRTYHSTIIATLASHTHMEEIKVFQNSNHTIMTPVIFTAGFSTSHGNAPSAKIFSLVREDHHWFLSNYETYHFINKNELTKLYDFQSYYCLQTKTMHVDDCLQQVTAEKIKKYFSAGNPNFSGILDFPENIDIPL